MHGPKCTCKPEDACPTLLTRGWAGGARARGVGGGEERERDVCTRRHALTSHHVLYCSREKDCSTQTAKDCSTHTSALTRSGTARDSKAAFLTLGKGAAKDSAEDG
jgi:hypothetical protein